MITRKTKYKIEYKKDHRCRSKNREIRRTEKIARKLMHMDDMGQAYTDNFTSREKISVGKRRKTFQRKE